MIRHVTYTNDLMTISADKCRSSALANGASESKIWRREDLPTNLTQGYPYNLNHFCDYWAWKSFILFEEIHSMKDGEILCYSDAGIEFVNNLTTVVNEMQDDIFLFSNGWRHMDWCKMDVMRAVGAKPGEEKQVQASLIFLRVSDKSKHFITVWFAECHRPNLIDDTPSVEPNEETFAEARHDQSILSALAIKYGIGLHWYPVTTAHHIKAEYVDTYPEIAWHHRRRNNEW